ncbi:hypothetical protein KAH81_06495 [bacterium]|nr:hypothetical protein [bacterium]
MTRVAELSVEELKSLIHESVEESIGEFFEDIMALGSSDYLKSIIEAREDYKKGRTKSFEEVFGV